jgi:hypothetical protein
METVDGKTTLGRKKSINRSRAQRGFGDEQSVSPIAVLSRGNPLEPSRS